MELAFDGLSGLRWTGEQTKKHTINCVLLKKSAILLPEKLLTAPLGLLKAPDQDT
jgi:hypothetical protein